MTALLKLSLSDVPPPGVDAPTRALINRLRFHASRCRASAHLDIHAACALIDPKGCPERAAATLLRVLGQALARVPVWHRVGEPALSFDERWLAQVIAARRRGDRDSYLFLTLRRVAPDKQRLFALLVAQVAAQAD